MKEHTQNAWFDFEGRRRPKVKCPYCGKMFAPGPLSQHKPACARKRTQKGAPCQT